MRVKPPIDGPARQRPYLQLHRLDHHWRLYPHISSDAVSHLFSTFGPGILADLLAGLFLPPHPRLIFYIGNDHRPAHALSHNKNNSADQAVKDNDGEQENPKGNGLFRADINLPQQKQVAALAQADAVQAYGKRAKRTHQLVDDQSIRPGDLYIQGLAQQDLHPGLDQVGDQGQGDGLHDDLAVTGVGLQSQQELFALKEFLTMEQPLEERQQHPTEEKARGERKGQITNDRNESIG